MINFSQFIASFLGGNAFDPHKIVIYYYDPFGNLLSTTTPNIKYPKEYLELDGEIRKKEAELKALLSEQKYEECIVVRDEIKEMTEKLKTIWQSHVDKLESEKDSTDILKELKKKLTDAVKNEDYEGAAKIRDELKQLNEKI